jgi:hypothetical protein
MTNPSDPWAQRPDSPGAPTERIGGPGRSGEPPMHTSEYSEAYGPGTSPTEPYHYADHPAGPNATRELPPYEGQWGTSETSYPGSGQQPTWASTEQFGAGPGGPPGPVGPTGLPVQPRRSRMGLWIAITLGIFVVVVLAGIAAGLMLAGHESPSSPSAGTTGRPSATRVPVVPPPTSGGPQPSLPQLPGLGNMDNLGATMGTVAGNDGSTLTVESVLGSTVTVHTDGKTQVIAMGGSKVADLHPGDMVVVQGDKSADGSILAKIIVSTQTPAPR